MRATRKRMEAIEQRNPKNGVCAIVQIPVRKSNLKGILEEADANEDGSRTVPVSLSRAELVLLLVTDYTLSQAEWQWHNDVRGKANDKVVLYFHGGPSHPSLGSAHLNADRLLLQADTP